MQKNLRQALKGVHWSSLLWLLVGWLVAMPSPTLFAQTATVSNQVLVAWGQNSAGQLNLPATITNVKAVDAGYDHGVALKNDGTVVVWGNTIQPPAGLNNVIAVAAGRYGTLALKNDGTVVAWGTGNYGQLNVPAGLNGVTAIAMGELQSLAVKQDGTVVAWGDGGSGMAVPAGLNNVTTVAASPTHNLALRRDGTVVAWGMSGSAGLKVPAGLNNVTAIAASRSVDLALKSDGTVVAWGSADSSMQPSAGLNNVSAIDIDQYHAIALKRDGTVVKWGYAYLQSVPSYVSGATAVAVGYEYSLALVTDTIAPETSLSNVPAQLSLNPSVFGLSGTDNILPGSAAPALTFECSLDGSSFAACTSPVSYHTLLPGGHTFAVRAKDSAGNVDATPLSYTWKIEDCADSYNVVDEKSLAMGLACFKQRTNPGVYTLHVLADIGLSVTPVVENTTANVSLLIDGQNHAWDGQSHQLNGLQVKPGTTATVQNLTIRNAVSPVYDAGGLFNQGILTLDGVTVADNRTRSIGGGIGNQGMLTVRNSTIRNNNAPGNGGGIGNWAGTATLENSTIMGNFGGSGGGLYNNQGATTTLNKVLFSGNTWASGGEVVNVAGGTLNGTPTYVPTCYWVQNDQTGQVLTVPNQSSTAGTALVAADKQTPTSGYQLWVRQGTNGLSSLPTGQWLTVAGGLPAAMTPAVIEPQTAGTVSQAWNANGYGDGAISLQSALNSYYLSPVDQTTAQTAVVLRSADDFRYNNSQNTRNKWWLVQAPASDCLDAMPAQAVSTPSAAQPAAANAVPAQRIYLPLVNKQG